METLRWVRPERLYPKSPPEQWKTLALINLACLSGMSSAPTFEVPRGRGQSESDIHDAMLLVVTPVGTHMLVFDSSPRFSPKGQILGV
ncbi:uncharacterized protein BDW43DRAFT_273605 [Aspergillus alliaceus]|uniref:uncharacterized protein n=1 Tax=Petromyces alliaceus TaxID=209559 RepID=UPI0012A3F155|nr:uncharacterized protein BDW43DRAFT_273605 [Aspergillus alliaceus]KAB8234598.1 hypothetical protein BDW43DRAFT_273605 [Aspergillus alliaceus]